MTAATEAPQQTAASRGVVGNRRLVAVQTFDIARLTSHPVPIEAGTFVAVSGVGPKGDSNGSGKTSFLAALALLLADPQWRLSSNGGKDASGLLFQPGAAGLDPSQQYPAASHGYVIGVFADPDAADVTAGSLTVWVRVATSSPYVEARWVDGLLLPDADGTGERELQADEMWLSLKGNKASARQMQATLYGTAPRCMTYLDTTLRPAVASLLSQQMTEMSPERIGESLLALCGLTGEMDAEAEQRSELARHQRELGEAELSDLRLTAEEDAELEGVHARDRARAKLSEGRRLWRLHCARGLIEVATEDDAWAERVEECKVAVDEAERALTDARDELRTLDDAEALAVAEQQARAAKERGEAELKEREGRLLLTKADRGRLAGERPALAAAAAGWTGTSAEDARSAVVDALRQQAAAETDASNAAQAVTDAERALADAAAGRAGGAGPVLARLTTAGLSAVGLLDTLTLDGEARAEWEPRLWTLRDAVVIAPADADAAVAAAADIAGAQLVLADTSLDAQPEPILPAGVHAGVPLGRLFAALQHRYAAYADPTRVSDDELGHLILGDFTSALTGRDTRIAAAEATRDDAVREHDRLRRIAATRTIDVQAAESALAAADAHETLIANDEQATELDRTIAEEESTVSEQQAIVDDLTGRWETALKAASSYDALRRAASKEVQLRDEHLRQTGAEYAEAVKSREALDLMHWQQAWGGDLDAARTYLAEELDEHVRGRSRHTWRNRANDALRDALAAYGVDTAEGAPDAELADVVRRREALAEGAGGIGRDAVEFTKVADPLQARLDGHAELDRVTAERVGNQRRSRHTSLAELQVEVQQRSASLTAVQDMIEQVIEARLHAIDIQLNRLDLSRGGYGAELQTTSVRPDSPTSEWRWQVTPRWKRGPASGMVSYREVANGAQVKVFAVQLVLAALLAAEGGEGRMLILDELGNSLGEVNRKDVLSALQAVATEQQVTILGTCQDSVLSDAADFCGQVLWFTHASASDAFNQPVRTWGHTDDGRLVELTRDWLTTGRPLV
ncbi:MAG TPA: hypothetical protein VHD58_06270 [Mycobacteriales bacterium]|nr:hypothetical protein [Mycobacteriales bacterium]